MRARSVLIVEDDRLNRETLGRLIRSLGCEVHLAGGVIEGVGHLSHRPDCLILDLDLPDGCGSDVARAARAADADCRIAFLTGSPTRPDMTFNPDAFFIKPIHPHQLLSWVQQHAHDLNQQRET